MKKFLLIGTAALVGMGALVHWSGDRSDATWAKISESEISIHGTPVCVTSDGKNIAARVGHCRSEGPGDGGGEEMVPSVPPGTGHGGPGGGLPPGHPPIGEGIIPDKGNVVRI